jgi:protein-disulfide isomerase
MLDERRQRTSITADEWILGQVHAPITVLEYGDFECPYCAMAAPELDALVASNPDLVRLVYRHFPLQVIHPHALRAAEASEAAGAQGKFWEMHRMLFGHQDALDDDSLRWYAQATGLDPARFDRDLIAHAYLDDARYDFRKGIQDGVNGTPTIFIAGRRYDGSRDRHSMKIAVAAVLASQHPELQQA